MREQIEINQKELEHIKSIPSTLIVDVREKGEFADFNIGGLNVPAHELNENLEEMKSYTNIIVVCSNGTRSSIIARVLLKKLPQATIYHLEEGIF